MPSTTRALDLILQKLMPSIAALPPEEMAVVLERFEPPSYARRRRLAYRDALVLEALAEAPGTTPTERAIALERQLKQAGGSGIAGAIVRLSDGQAPIGWKHISRIEREARVVRTNSGGDAHSDSGLTVP